MRKVLHIMIDGVRYIAIRDGGTTDTEAAVESSLQMRGRAPPPDEETRTMDPMDEERTPGPKIGRFERHLITPPMLFGCERMPFLVWLGVIAFLVVAVFGITPWGLIGGALMFAGGVIWLRQIAEGDAQWFAMRLERMKYPTHMPDVLPDPRLKDWDFVGFDDPPAPETVLKAWAGVSAAALVPAGLVALIFGIVPGMVVFAGLMLAVILWVFWQERITWLRRARD